MTRPIFSRYVGIDYSGAETPSSSLKGLRVYEASRELLPAEIEPPPSPRKYWTRCGLAQWLVERLSEGEPTLVGIDHGFSFPLRYFEVHLLEPDWQIFLDDFRQHWPTDGEHTYVDFVRDGVLGNGEARSGSPRWRRITEERAGAKSVFHFRRSRRYCHFKGGIYRLLRQKMVLTCHIPYLCSSLTHWPQRPIFMSKGHLRIDTPNIDNLFGLARLHARARGLYPARVKSPFSYLLDMSKYCGQQSP